MQNNAQTPDLIAKKHVKEVPQKFKITHTRGDHVARQELLIDINSILVTRGGIGINVDRIRVIPIARLAQRHSQSIHYTELRCA